ncbi:rhomboid family intramembrane serine protease [uncultured Lentibacter sp.]|uniref:rhomboid family intramembrane serine protease n=1 Tax=uncultured Lentibacter sp. TaxID=1659309 RepID=UPI0026030797|nr:rhomboid family intramembrane serine protease [uncultured Lentibacter sp.]
MFPFRDHNPSGRTPYVTYALIAANIAVFLSYWHLFADPRALSEFYTDYALIPAAITAGQGYEGLVSSMFLHGGVMHLGGNMLFLWIFGDNMEDEMGHLGFFGFYIMAGLLAGFVHVLFAPGSAVPTVGASGAIAGVMGGYLLLFPRAKVDILLIIIIFFRVVTLPAYVMLAVWFGLQFFGGLGADPDSGGVAYWAHSGGFIAGLVLTLPTFIRLGGPRFWRDSGFHPPHPETRYDRSRIPTIRRRK